MRSDRPQRAGGPVSVRKLRVVQHAASEPLGVLDPMLRRWGFRIRYANFARDPGLQLDLSRYDGQPACLPVARLHLRPSAGRGWQAAGIRPGGTIAVAVQSNDDASFTNHARTNPAGRCSRRGSSYRLRITTAVLH